MVHIFKLNADLSIELKKSLDLKPGDDLIFMCDTKTFSVEQVADMHQALTRWLSDYRVTTVPAMEDIKG